MTDEGESPLFALFYRQTAKVNGGQNYFHHIRSQRRQKAALLKTGMLAYQTLIESLGRVAS
jgi:hypothetical protein